MQNSTPVDAAPAFRNQQVVGSSPTAGSREQKTYRLVTNWKGWQGAYRGAYRKLSRWLGSRPAVLSRLSEAEDVQQDRAYQRLVRKLRG
jgi:hypothetical protein